LRRGVCAAWTDDVKQDQTTEANIAVVMRIRRRGLNTGSPLVIGVEDTEDSKPKDGRR